MKTPTWKYLLAILATVVLNSFVLLRRAGHYLDHGEPVCGYDPGTFYGDGRAIRKAWESMP